MSGETLQSFEREAWVIPNGHGQLWTDRVFDTEAEAATYLDKKWHYGSRPPAVRPTRARVLVTATLITGGSDVEA